MQDVLAFLKSGRNAPAHFANLDKISTKKCLHTLSEFSRNFNEWWIIFYFFILILNIFAWYHCHWLMRLAAVSYKTSLPLCLHRVILAL